ncbi:unnamed protein product [Arctogadus glacialis]
MDRQTETHWASSARPRPPAFPPGFVHRLVMQHRMLTGAEYTLAAVQLSRAVKTPQVLADGAAFVIGREPADISAVFHVAE